CVGRSWQSVTGESEAAACRFAPTLVSQSGRMQRSPAALVIAVEAALDAVPPPDIVIVTDLDLSLDADPRGRWREEAAWLPAARARGAVICSICSGAVFLAEAGLLDGLEATTHWAATGLFRRHYPQVRLRAERILSPAGEG